ncbi:MAG TPA: DNA polymerase III subunit alpha, partial [Bacteroidetes bacterium]|nr:DNA polymerase III subunit alpha [Bacteroidota bacterium]
MAAVLTHNMGDIKKISQFIEECQHINVPVDAPNINTGKGQFVAIDNRIQFGLEAIKGVGSNAVANIVEIREEGGAFKSFIDMVSRVDLRSCSKKTIESLIQAGAFDTLNPNRNQLMESLEDVVTYAVRKQQEDAMNQISLFSDAKSGGTLTEPKLKEISPWTSMERLKREREFIGFFLSGHPLNKYQEDAQIFCSHNLGSDSIGVVADRSSVSVAGIITIVRHTRDKKGRPIAFATIEDQNGAAELLIFSDPYDKHMNLLHQDTLIVVDGTVDNQSGQPKVIVRNIDRIENLREKNQGRFRLKLRLDLDEIVGDDIQKIAAIFN